jgi:uncharacterized protein
MSRVVRRCPAGSPAVVEDLPYDRAGRPFPTLFYCTCPSLVAAIGKLEAAGGVRAFGALAAGDPLMTASLAAAVRYTRRRRRELVRRCGLPMLDDGASLRTGVGGVADARRITCLHAHAAQALARPGYALGERILAAAGELWDHDGVCAVRMVAAGVTAADPHRCEASSVDPSRRAAVPAERCGRRSAP